MTAVVCWCQYTYGAQCDGGAVASVEYDGHFLYTLHEHADLEHHELAAWARRLHHDVVIIR